MYGEAYSCNITTGRATIFYGKIFIAYVSLSFTLQCPANQLLIKLLEEKPKDLKLYSATYCNGEKIDEEKAKLYSIIENLERANLASMKEARAFQAYLIFWTKCPNNMLIFVTNRNENKRGRPSTYWTQRGIIRLGMFIRNERAVRFRDFAENVLVEKLEEEIAQKVTAEEQGISGLLPELIQMAKTMQSMIVKHEQTDIKITK